jgi:hypothetical protein
MSTAFLINNENRFEITVTLFLSARRRAKTAIQLDEGPGMAGLNTGCSYGENPQSRRYARLIYTSFSSALFLSLTSFESIWVPCRLITVCLSYLFCERRPGLI